MPLKIAGINDKVGQGAVRLARLDVKKHRVAVEKKRKELKADALAYGKKVDSAAKLLTEKLLEIENHLIAEEKTVKDEIDRVAREIEEEKRAKLQTRLDKLAAVECMVVSADVEEMTDAQFDAKLFVATNDYRQKKADFEAEQRRLEAVEAERKREEEEAAKQRKAEEERLAAERKKIEEEKARIEAEKAKIEAEKQQILAEQLKAEKKAAEAKQREEEAKAEAARQRKIEELRPDMEKLARVAVAVAAIKVPKMASADAEDARVRVVLAIEAAAEQIRHIAGVE
jgi:DNA repair exonuclease SbcCD ATPase subunit